MAARVDESNPTVMNSLSRVPVGSSTPRAPYRACASSRRGRDDRAQNRLEIEIGTDRQDAIEQLPQLLWPSDMFHCCGSYCGVGGCEQWRTRIFLVDDHEVVRRGVREPAHRRGRSRSRRRSRLRRRGTTAHSGSSGPTLPVLDVRLPDGAASSCAATSVPRTDLACLMLTSFDDDEALFEAIVAGAAGYVLKQVKGSDIVNAVRQVGAGRSLLDPIMTSRVLQRLRHGTAEDERLAGLSGQEARRSSNYSPRARRTGRSASRCSSPRRP